LEGEFRRTIADGSRPAPERLAALAALPRTGARPSEWWGSRSWTDPGTPLYEEAIRTSYSRLSNMNNCALQYLYQIEMGLDPEQSFQMWLGSVIHSIIDRVQRGEIPREKEPVLAALEEVWRPELFPNAAIEHRRRIDARQMLSRWIEHEHAEPLASEVGFEFPIGDAILRGKIDAVFPMNRRGRLRVVDYKTGRGYPTEEEVKEDLQLAAYYLAVKRTPELAELGEPSYLQLAYIGIPNSRDGFKRLAVSPAQREDYEGWAEDTITGLVGEIRSEQFAPDPEADCMWCRFKAICPMWPEGGEAVR
jgi:RecB family exonuclease